MFLAPPHPDEGPGSLCHPIPMNVEQHPVLQVWLDTILHMSVCASICHHWATSLPLLGCSSAVVLDHELGPATHVEIAVYSLHISKI
jgi:hypothetical protein